MKYNRPNKHTSEYINVERVISTKSDTGTSVGISPKSPCKYHILKISATTLINNVNNRVFLIFVLKTYKYCKIYFINTKLKKRYGYYFDGHKFKIIGTK